MNEAFGKILERLKEATYRIDDSATLSTRDVVNEEDAKEIVQEVAEEYNDGWIPCSERLPEYGEVVMCSCTNGGITISCITHKGVIPSKSVRFGQHLVIAWKSLPSPYQPKGE